MKCILCGQRKGKRHCPAKSTLICARCCGEKRMVEVDCPPDCSYLESGHLHHAQKKILHQVIHEENPARAQRYIETVQHYGGVLAALEQTILRYSSGLSSLHDRDVLEALQLLRKNCQTEEKGILYDHTSTNPLAESLTRELTATLQEFRDGDEEGRLLRLSEALDCLGNLIRDVQYHLDGQPLTYLQFIARSHPEVTGETKGSLLIQP